MATFQQIFANLFLGAIVFCLSLVAFDLAFRWEFNNQLAPRSWSRPKAILKNVLQRPYFYSWIPWSMKLTYPDLMDGIPGTGTRKDGWSGPMLKCNLDGIIMLKFHTMMLKVSILASVLCICIVLPLNYTAQCDTYLLGAGTCGPLQNLTNFEQCTIANIPPIIFDAFGNTTDDDVGIEAEMVVEDRLGETWWVSQVSTRYLFIVLVSWAIYYYTCALLWWEWIDNLALRRTFFLEHDHFQERVDELDATMQLKDPEDPFQRERPPWLPHPELRETIPNVSLYSVLYQLPNQITTFDLPEEATDLDRHLAATVAFFDGCVPNQPGFSSSVAAVSILPEATHVAEAWKKWYKCGKKLRQLRYIRSHIQRRLLQQPADEEVFIEEKDKKRPPSIKEHENRALPNVETAVEELKEEKEQRNADEATGPHVAVGDDEVKSNLAPEAEEISAVPKERTLQGESTQTGIAAVISNAKQVVFASEESHDVENKAEAVDDANVDSTSTDAATAASGSSNEEEQEKTEKKVERADSNANRIKQIDSGIGSDPGPTPEQEFSYSDFNIVEYAKIIGLAEETELDNLVSGDLGIEQLSVYAREYAQSSSNACPFGCGTGLIRFSTLEKLKVLEEEILEAARVANEELIEARTSVNRLTSGELETAESEEGEDDASMSKIDDENAGLLDPEKGIQQPAKESKSLRKRATASSAQKWKQAQSLAQSIQGFPRKSGKKDETPRKWVAPWRRAVGQTREIVENNARRFRRTIARTGNVVTNVLEHPTYAVITFTSRQAAIAARQCLADGGGLDRWVEIKELPIAPLADAPPWDIMFCRGFCRPVTLTISDNEKKCRRFTAITIYLLFCLFYTIPLALTSQLLNPEKLAEFFPDWEALQNSDTFFFRVLAGISSGLLYTLFFSFCPQLFKAIANFEGNVSSKRTAEDKALHYYWYFMLVTAFTGTSLAQMVGQGLFNGLNLGKEMKEVLVTAANSIPTQQAPVWLNWIIVRFTYTLPFMYLFQANTFGFSIIRWAWCGRLMRGGIYVDSGTVFMCIVAMAPVCPVIAPAATIYYMVIIIMLRWLLVFVYRPWYDTGGNKWPTLHDIIISATIFGQVLLTTIIVLKKEYLAAVLAGAVILPTYWFSQTCKTKFLRSYNDAGLLQTSRLDGWDTSVLTSKTTREEYRLWLVDCHKASYVPICLAGSDSLLTVEPAAIVPTERDKDKFQDKGILKKQRSQRGAVFLRQAGANSLKYDPSEDD